MPSMSLEILDLNAEDCTVVTGNLRKKEHRSSTYLHRDYKILNPKVPPTTFPTDILP